MPANKVAIITGSSRGIGAAIAQKIASKGVNVVINFTSDETGANKTLETVRSLGAHGLCIKADVTKKDQVRDMFQKTKETFGRVDYLVNNAGVLTYSPVVDISEEDFDRMFAINVKGTLFCCQLACEYLEDGGSIVNLSSSTTMYMIPNYGCYVASKGAVEQLTRSLSREVASRGIRVNVVSPGPVDTELFRAGKTNEQIKRFEQMSAFNRLGQPDDIAGVVAFLLSDDSKWMTGQNVRANGGMA
jgi:3-oxoacyl-[acyl-carrier protein] reductase